MDQEIERDEERWSKRERDEERWSKRELEMKKDGAIDREICRYILYCDESDILTTPGEQHEMFEVRH